MIYLISLFLGLFITLFIILFFIRKLYNKLYLFPKIRRDISENLEIEEEVRISEINRQIKSASKGLNANVNPLWKKVHQNFIDNHARGLLEEHYMLVRKNLSERSDFDKEYVQANYINNEGKIENLFQESPYIDLDIESEFPKPVIEAYKQFSQAWFNLTNTSELIVQCGIPNFFPRFAFGRVTVGEVWIPSFANSYGDIIYFFPTFSIVLKKDFSISFYPLDEIRIRIDETTKRFLPSEYPKDATFVKESWLYSNKDGSRDARYSYNQRYVHYKIANIYFFGAANLFTLEASNLGLSSLMKKSFLNLKKTILDHPFNTDTEKVRNAKPTNQSLDQKGTKNITPENHNLDKNYNMAKSDKHYVGEKHPTKPWVWTEYAPGKFDWRKDRSVQVTTTSAKLEENSIATEELNSLIGLSGVKAEIANLQNFIKIQLVRKSQGLRTSPISYHCVFTGNPGTGKTTVARIVAEIYRDMGILKKGHLIETDRSGLVAEYVGQTAVKTNEVIDSALDGVLFIDEAYSLVSSSSNDYGHEAIATLLKRMEDDRDRLVVILAGYGNEMQKFIDSNPGLQSRFNRYIHFDDYSAEDLLAIFELTLKKHQYKISDSAKILLKRFLVSSIANKDQNFGNGRFVRNVFEKTLQNQATRLAAMHDLSKSSLQLIVDEDIPTK